MNTIKKLVAHEDIQVTIPNDKGDSTVTISLHDTITRNTMKKPLNVEYYRAIVALDKDKRCHINFNINRDTIEYVAWMAKKMDKHIVITQSIALDLDDSDNDWSNKADMLVGAYKHYTENYNIDRIYTVVNISNKKYSHQVWFAYIPEYRIIHYLEPNGIDWGYGHIYPSSVGLSAHEFLAEFVQPAFANIYKDDPIPYYEKILGIYQPYPTPINKFAGCVSSSTVLAIMDMLNLNFDYKGDIAQVEKKYVNRKSITWKNSREKISNEVEYFFTIVYSVAEEIKSTLAALPKKERAALLAGADRIGRRQEYLKALFINPHP